MSDITKKIFSIEPDMSEPDIAEVVESIEAEPVARVAPPSGRTSRQRAADPVPDFITRDQPVVAHAVPLPDAPKTGWIMWTGIALTLIWVAALCAYFLVANGSGEAITSSTMGLTGAIMAVLLPAVLITLLWLTWRRLARVTHDAQRIAYVAETLTRADQAALGTTQSLARGIRAELSEVDRHLAKTIEDFTTLKVNLSAEKHSIDQIGLSLTERSEDVGRNLTLQRQALEAISGTFESKMETLTTVIERQSLALTDTSKKVNSDVNVATENLTSSTNLVEQAGTAFAEKLSGASEIITGSEDQLNSLNTRLSDMIALLQSEQEKLKTDLSEQIEKITAITKEAEQNTGTLLASLETGQQTVTALNQASIVTNETINQQFSDMADQISNAQVKAADVSEKAATRVQENLAETRKDLSKLETDMLALQAKLRNARTKSEELDLGETLSESPQNVGVGRLRLKPLETDFPPVEPPRFTAPLRDTQTRDMLDLDANKIVELPDEIPLTEPLNLGADMTIASPDDEITHYEPDVLRRPAPETKSFGRTKNKPKTAWRWRDMLGGLERPDPDASSASDIVKPLFGAPLSPPPQTPAASAASEGGDIVATLCQLQLAPSAIVDDGTIIEASNAFVDHGVEAMQANVASRLKSPAEHLRHELQANPSRLQAFQSFTAQYADKLNEIPPYPANLRAELGTAQGRAFLICAAAFS